jgi:hypothetical protein
MSTQRYPESALQTRHCWKWAFPGEIAGAPRVHSDTARRIGPLGRCCSACCEGLTNRGSLEPSHSLAWRSTVPIDTDGCDPARRNIVRAGGSPDARMAMTASLDSQNVMILQVPSSPRTSVDWIRPAGADAVSSQAERRSSSRSGATRPSVTVTNTRPPPRLKVTSNA